jgi:hypothetical protein
MADDGKMEVFAIHGLPSYQIPLLRFWPVATIEYLVHAAPNDNKASLHNHIA